MRKKYTVIRHARLVDGTGAPAIEDAVFVFFNGDTVSDDRLVYCGDAAGYDPSITADGEVFALDLADSTYTILPGLVNTHVHLSLELPYLPYYVDKFGDAYRAMVTYRRACEALLCGVTTLRGVGQCGHLRDRRPQCHQQGHVRRSPDHHLRLRPLPPCRPRPQHPPQCGVLRSG